MHIMSRKSPEWQQGIKILLHNANNEHKSLESFSDKACLHTNYFLQPYCTLNWRLANATDYRVGNNATVGGQKEGQCNRQWSRWTEDGPVQETTVSELKPGQHSKQQSNFSMWAEDRPVQQDSRVCELKTGQCNRQQSKWTEDWPAQQATLWTEWAEDEPVQQDNRVYELQKGQCDRQQSKWTEDWPVQQATKWTEAWSAQQATDWTEAWPVQQATEWTEDWPMQQTTRRTKKTGQRNRWEYIYNI